MQVVPAQVVPSVEAHAGATGDLENSPTVIEGSAATVDSLEDSLPTVIEGSVHTAEDVVKLLMCGADSIQVCSALLRHGPSHLKTLLGDLERWGQEHEYESVEQMKGSMSHKTTPHPDLFERVNYLKTLQSWE